MRYPLVYGGLSGALIIAILCIGLATGLPEHFTSPVFGYLIMLAALSLIFVGVKRYRDIELGGVIRFWPAFGLGVAIAAVAALVYIVGWEIFLATSGVDFMAEMQAHMIRKMEAEGASAAEIAETQAMMAEMAALYPNPLFRIPITFLEIFPVGLAVALVSAAILRNPAVLPLRRTA